MKDYAVLTNDGKYTIYEMRDTDREYPKVCVNLQTDVR